jgi:DNA-binding protein H-NS
LDFALFKEDKVSIWFLVQLVINVFFLLGLSLCIAKLFKKQEDDPRLTQGLRLLQSKISILEDLSDHTETQVKQLMTMLDKKMGEVRATMNSVNQHMHEVDRSIQQGQKMAEQIYQEINPDKMIEKKIENKYIQAARLAHQGWSVAQIVEQLSLPRAEVDLIVKVNKNKCIYEDRSQVSVRDEIFSRSLEMPRIQNESIEKTQADFQKAVQDGRDFNESDFRSIKLG